MSQQHRGILGRVFVFLVGRSVRRFRSRHRWVLVGLEVALAGAVLCRDSWDGFPRWPVYALTAAVVLDALLHARVNKAFEERETQALRDLLALASTVET